MMLAMLKQLTQARWFPTISKPLISGLLASGVVFGLHAVGITDFTSNEANAAITPLAGFLVTAIVARTKTQEGQGGDITDPIVDPKPAPSLGSVVADILTEDIKAAIDANPELVKTLASNLLTRLLASTTPTAATQPSQPRSNLGAVVGPNIDQGQPEAPQHLPQV